MNTYGHEFVLISVYSWLSYFTAYAAMVCGSRLT